MNTLIGYNNLFEDLADPNLRKLVNGISLPMINSTDNVFHDLMSCIVEQQIHYRSTKKTFEKLLSYTSITELTPHNFHEFEKLALPRTRLSDQKCQTILNLLDFWKTNVVDWPTLSDDEVRLKLGSIKGIGNWTIDMILLYTLQRPDIFPADDYHLKQVMTKLYGLNPESRLKANMFDVANNWKPNRSNAVLYLLEAKRQGLG